MPTMPVKAAGWRIEPPVSVPVAPGQRRAATAAADPPEDPPGTRKPFGVRPSLFACSSRSLACAPSQLGGSQGDTTGPKAEVSLDEPMANSSLLILPSMTAPSRQSWLVTVDS
jgi:hypothetical protein